MPTETHAQSRLRKLRPREAGCPGQGLSWPRLGRPLQGRGHCVHSGPSMPGAWGLRTPLLLLRPLGQVPAPRPGQALCRGGPGLAQWRQPAAQLSGINPHTADSVLGPAQRPTVPFLPPPFLPSSPGSGRLGAEDKHATLGAARPDQP